jgi:hypothetical protein
MKTIREAIAELADETTAQPVVLTYWWPETSAGVIAEETFDE